MQKILARHGFLSSSQRRFVLRKLPQLTLAAAGAAASLTAGVALLRGAPAPQTPRLAQARPAQPPLGALLVGVGQNQRLALAAPVAEEQPLTTASIAPQPPARPDEIGAENERVASLANPPLPPARPAEYAEAEAPTLASAEAPTPPRRPDGLGASIARAPEPALLRQTARQERTTIAPATPADGGSFFDRLFGGPQQQAAAPQTSGRSGRALAYAAPESQTPSALGGFSSLRSAAVSPGGRFDRYTAVYDISARTVYMPDGSKLEAHSGLREHLDDPRYVHLRMRGATPPNVYSLTPREALFHGVEALRLTPTAGGTYGRAGLLAHTFMLGPNGDSNGCVSFRDYRAFLDAYKRGDVRRLAVVAHL